MMSTNAKTTASGAEGREAPVITEEDLAVLDTTGEANEPLHATDPVNRIFLRIGGTLCVVLTVGITALVTASVILRYFFNSSIPIAAEGPSYFFPWLIAGGAIVAQAQLGHVAVDVLVSRLGEKGYARAQLAIWIFVTILAAYLTYLGIYMAGPIAEQTSPIMGWPQLGSFSAFIVMTACLALQAAARTYLLWRHGPAHAETFRDDTTTGHLKGMPA
ncbi:TRAP transporter small permease [Kocuria sabuli]|uniref:TRAP transporter small permease n=1 Tax=Kocuria sabuli TaxID=3071448 RepID=UPI0034D39D4B